MLHCVKHSNKKGLINDNRLISNKINSIQPVFIKNVPKHKVIDENFILLPSTYLSKLVVSFSIMQGRTEKLKGVTVSRGPGLKREPGSHQNKRKSGK
jgi:hypothetical protein